MDEDVSIESCMNLDRYWFYSIWKCRDADEASQSQNEKAPIARIYRIPQMLRDNNKFGKYYKPSFVSIGLYHYGNPTLREGQILKHIIANKFVSNDQRKIKVLHDKLLDKIVEVRECCDENLRYPFGDHELVRMMLLDGCFILYYIKCVLERSRSDLEMKGQVIAIVQEDLFLLENQLPFFVLRLLMINSTILTEDQWMQKISMFIQKNIMASEKNEVEPLNYEMEGPSNLLELLYQRMVAPAPGSYEYTQSKQERFTFPSLKQLTAVGIQLKTEHTNRLTEIDFDSSTACYNPRRSPTSAQLGSGSDFMGNVSGKKSR